MKPPGRAAKPTVAILALCLLAGPAALAAKPTEQQRAAVLQAVVDCRGMKDAGQRLACYDAAAARLDEAEASGQVVVVDRQQAQQVRREVFGLSLPSLDLFDKDEAGPADRVDTLTDTVKSASRGADGRWVVELQNGAVWRQIDDIWLLRGPRPGAKVQIRKAALGSFMLKVEGLPALRAHRDR